MANLREYNIHIKPVNITIYFPIQNSAVLILLCIILSEKFAI